MDLERDMARKQPDTNTTHKAPGSADALMEMMRKRAQERDKARQQ